ncbi:Eco57I restriction-modification methylase domain-containing protein [Enterococcus faecalis]|uniref:Eco57I restriction-modification methylase domain-containing protein n=1 Tax=Enterococcus faecalis TaxID=1351 RepID=UPI001784BEEE|nr:Eco57I restriction-modification methylase domain-containing protein [Enterococcus faecalis]MBD9769335.1 Eco57I restriction-modification methylase domain-containing protein [Enterococcus faecalis]MBD9771917.1 Eco57I restriction-modification methylase domain-containing protein [Enterococcus faecalis]MBD9795533.1 Eco57I restriction-modification methylase domain-containing protein [Enterococcus faecalis]
MDKTVIKPFEEIKYKVYGYTLPEVPNHNGYVKIGDTTREVVTRIFEQVGTAGLNPKILFEKVARKSDGEWFRDKDLHRFLILNGIEKKDFNSRADEWFYFNGTLEKAEELTNKFINRDYDEIQIDDKRSDYVLRNEQQQAVEKTYEYYQSNQEPKEFLWNAKPRFGKTLTTYDFIRNLNARNVLIVTNRPAIANSWFDDFNKFIAWQEPQMKFVSETDALNGKAMTRDQYLEFIDTTSHANPTQIAFISLQDLKGAEFAGGMYKKLEWVAGLNWDLLVIDEAHEGIDTRKTDIAFSQLKRDFTLHLSGTPFKALAKGDFSEEQIFNWSYVDEQEAKENWDPTIGSNPYESLPTLNLFTYQMSKMIEDEVSAGLTIEEEKNVDYAFDLNEFFRVKENGRFEYEESVVRFLDNLSSGKFPFSENQYRNELKHTFWLLPRVNSAKALEKLLNSHPTFKDYKVVLAAGDGVSLHDGVEAEALDLKENTKSFDKVRNAIEQNDKTITLSVGQLTTGVTIPEWTAVLMLNNIESPSLYFQAAFRSQNPYEYEEDGKLFRKENAYIFDFSPDRTLRLYDEFANNLSSGSSKTSEERKRKIKKLLNFFPVIAEDEEGTMHEIDASEVLTIPTRITSREVVKRGFMSNLLFANISGIFSGDSPFKEILDKIPPEKNKRLEKPREISVTNPHLNDDGEVEIPKEVVIGKSKELFGEKIYTTIEVVDDVVSSLEEAEEKQKESIKRLAKNITESFSEGFTRLKDSFNLNKGQTDKLKDSVNNSIEDIINEKSLTLSNQVKELEKEYESKIQEAETIKDESILKAATHHYEKQKQKIEESFTEEINKEVEKTINTVVEEQIEKVEEKKKKTTEDDVRDHLRGFARTIPAFLMAYGVEDTRLENFEVNIDEATFEDLTSITIEEFKRLRDGFEYPDNNGETKVIPGLFNEVVFNASIQEFLETKNRLANYFDDSLQEDIFDYIPPQKTNQIFTPRRVVKSMVDSLEKRIPGIFSDKTRKFADLYVKSGMYITEIVKRLNHGLKDQIPNQQERIKWILENQVYACAPSNIIYNIAKNYILGEMEHVSNTNIIELDTLALAKEAKLSECIYKEFGDVKMKFDVIIGNPPYQEENTERNRDDAIYHLFLDEAYKIAEKVVMITPARFLFNVGSTPKIWNEKMLNDKHLSVEMYERKSEKIFPNTSIIGGIAVTYRDASKILGPIGTFTPYQELNSILSKVKEINQESNFSSLMFVQNKFNLDKLYRDFPDFETRLGGNGRERRLTSSIFNVLPEIFSDKKTKEHNLAIYGRENNKRTYKYVSKEYIEEHPNMYKWKVFVPAANGASGTIGDSPARIISFPVLGEPNSGHTQTFISLGAFDTKFEGEALLKYIKSKFARAMLGVLKVTQNNKTQETWSKVPVLDFTKDSDIDWEKPLPEIDQSIYKKFSLNQNEIDFIENHITYLDEESLNNL